MIKSFAARLDHDIQIYVCGESRGMECLRTGAKPTNCFKRGKNSARLSRLEQEGKEEEGRGGKEEEEESLQKALQEEATRILKDPKARSHALLSFLLQASMRRMGRRIEGMRTRSCVRR